jgi:hypothetical protein
MDSIDSPSNPNGEVPMRARRLPLVTLLTLLAGCGGDGPFSNSSGGVFMSARIGNEEWEAGSWQHWPVTGLYHRETDPRFFAISGVGVVGEDRWEIGLYIPASEGTHSLALTGHSGFVVYQVLGGAGNGHGSTHYTPDSLDPGTVSLTLWDPEHRIIEGSFSLSAREDGTDEKVMMTGGRFRVRYDDPPGP